MTQTHCKRGHERTPENLTKSGACKVCRADLNRERWQKDPEYAEHRREISRRYRATQGEALRARRRARDKERYATDPAYREMRLRLARESTSRALADPKRRPILLEGWRIYQSARRRQAAIPERNWDDNSTRGDATHSNGERLPAEPLRRTLEEWKAANPDVSWVSFAALAGLASRRLQAVRYRQQELVSTFTVGAVLDAMGHPEWFDMLYPPKGEISSIPSLAAAPLPRRATAPTFCRSGDDCSRKAGHGPNGRFCPHHGAELDRIKAELQAAADLKMTKLNRGRASANRIKRLKEAA